MFTHNKQLLKIWRTVLKHNESDKTRVVGPFNFPFLGHLSVKHKISLDNFKTYLGDRGKRLYHEDHKGSLTVYSSIRFTNEQTLAQGYIYSLHLWKNFK